MKLHTQDRATETPELRITQATGAILLSFDKNIHDLVTERITTYIERPNGGEEPLATNILLKHAIIASVYGEGDLKQTSEGTGAEARYQTTVLMEIANGSILLGSDETIKLKLTDLTRDNIYNINTIQYPETATSAVLFNKLTILADETSRSFNVSDKDLIIIDNFNLTRDTTLTYSNGHKIKFTPAELQAIAYEVEPIFGYDKTTGSTIHQDENTLAFPLTDVIEIEFQKIKGFQEITTVKY